MLDIMTSYTWPNDGIPFAGLRIRIDDLAARLGLIVHTWDVDGLGPARGFGFRVASGRVYLLQELEVAVRYHGACGPGVYADAAELAIHGAEVLVDEVVAALGLSLSDAVDVAGSAVQQSAAELVARVDASRAKRGS